MKTLYFLLLLLLFSVLTIVVMNELSPVPTTAYKEGKCTRYCHNKTCLHMEKNQLTNTLLVAYNANIRWLKDNPVGLSYREMNLLVYVLVYPVVVGILLWGILRKRYGSTH